MTLEFGSNETTFLAATKFHDDNEDDDENDDDNFRGYLRVFCPFFRRFTRKNIYSLSLKSKE